MLRSLLLLLLVWLFAVPAVMSQSLDRVVVAASGSELTAVTADQFTIGETLTEVAYLHYSISGFSSRL